MNIRTFGIVLIGVILLTGIGTVMLGGSTDGPFEKDNSTLPTPKEPVNSSQGVDNNTLTEQAVTLNTLRLSQESFRIEVTTTEKGESITEQTLYTPTTSYKSVSENGKVIYEYFYTPEYTAVKQQSESGATYNLRDPQTRVSDHLREQSLYAVVSAINMTASQKETRNGENYTTYTGDTIRSNGNQLAASFGVDSIVRVQEAKIVRNEDTGIITDASISLVVENNDARYTVSREYNLMMNESISVQAHPWVQVANERNAGVDSYIVSDSEVRLYHKYGKTFNSGDSIQLRTPDGSEYTATFNSSFGPGDTAVVVKQNESLRVLVNPQEQPDSEQFVDSTGQYTIVFTSDGVVITISSVTK